MKMPTANNSRPPSTKAPTPMMRVEGMGDTRISSW
jgi:hypothetical protein